MPRAAQQRPAPGPGELAVARRPGPVPVLSLAGELDATTCPGLRRRLQAELPRCRTLVVDLSGLDFLDVAGARVLAELVRAGSTEGVGIALVGLSPLARCTAYTVGLPLPAVAHRSVTDALRQLGS